MRNDFGKKKRKAGFSYVAINSLNDNTCFTEERAVIPFVPGSLRRVGIVVVAISFLIRNERPACDPFYAIRPLGKADKLITVAFLRGRSDGWET